MMGSSVEQIETFIENTTVSDTMGTYWYPLRHLKVDIPVEVYNLDKLYSAEQSILLEKLFRRCGIRAVTMVQLQANGIVRHYQDIFMLLYEEDENGYNFPWCAETYYFDHTKQWLVYVSHEGTITFAGEMLTKTAKKLLPDRYLEMGFLPQRKEH